MKHALWLAPLWLAGCCCLRARAPEPPAVAEPATAVTAEPVAEPVIAEAAPAIVAAPETAIVATAPEPPPAEPAPPPRPPQTEHGQWCVVVVSERTIEAARVWARRLARAGFRAEIVSVEVGGTKWKRVLLPGYRAQGEARAAVPLANAAAGVKDSFILRPRSAQAAGN